MHAHVLGYYFLLCGKYSGTSRSDFQLVWSLPLKNWYISRVCNLDSIHRSSETPHWAPGGQCILWFENKCLLDCGSATRKSVATRSTTKVGRPGRNRMEVWKPGFPSSQQPPSCCSQVLSVGDSIYPERMSNLLPIVAIATFFLVAPSLGKFRFIGLLTERLCRGVCWQGRLGNLFENSCCLLQVSFSSEDITRLESCGLPEDGIRWCLNIKLVFYNPARIVSWYCKAKFSVRTGHLFSCCHLKLIGADITRPRSVSI